MALLAHHKTATRAQCTQKIHRAKVAIRDHRSSVRQAALASKRFLRVPVFTQDDLVASIRAADPTRPNLARQRSRPRM